VNIVNEILPPDQAILVFGSLNAKLEDRYHSRSEINPVQLISDGKVIKLPFFNDWGEVGASSMVYQLREEVVLYLTTGPDLIELRFGEKALSTQLEVANLKDVHEITLIDNLLWLANTGYDEVVAFDLSSRKVLHRIQLERFKLKTNLINKSLGNDETEWQEIDRFHCNQVFKGIDGNLYALVHHTTGKQLQTRIAKRLLKKQGDGGVIDLKSGKSIQLWLKAPHTVRIVNGEYWVFDSGGRAINIYSPDWRLKSKIATIGWGRGADLSNDGSLFYAGISEKRARYRESDDLPNKNMVQVFRTKDGVCVGQFIINDGIEQINNVYVIPNYLADIFFSL
jgi:hypothetical protein